MMKISSSEKSRHKSHIPCHTRHTSGGLSSPGSEIDVVVDYMDNPSTSRYSANFDDIFIDSSSPESVHLRHKHHLSFRPVTLLNSSHGYEVQNTSSTESSPVNENRAPTENIVELKQSSVLTQPGIDFNSKYRAIKDYNPKLFSTSGNAEKELALEEGDVIQPLGEKNSLRCIS